MPNNSNNIKPLPLMPGYQRDLAEPSITRTVVSRIGARVGAAQEPPSPSLPHGQRVVRAMVPQW